MMKNIHPVERILRVGAGAVLVSMAFWGAQNSWLLLVLVPLATGVIGWCRPYALPGISTAKKCAGQCCWVFPINQRMPNDKS